MRSTQKSRASELWRPKELLKSLLLLTGGEVRCEVCGERLFLGKAFVRGGAIKLVGAEYALVQVDFDSMNRLVFRHAAAGECVRPRDVT